jgi:hypothetical protein
VYAKAAETEVAGVWRQAIEFDPEGQGRTNDNGGSSHMGREEELLCADPVAARLVLCGVEFGFQKGDVGCVDNDQQNEYEK